MDFELDEEHRLFQRTLADFVDREIAPSGIRFAST